MSGHGPLVLRERGDVYATAPSLTTNIENMYMISVELLTMTKFEGFKP
jgi:hypothetical protein